ncbi:MAG: hypothetical protein RL011_959 [Pseudomonadota bacterium]
MTVAAGQKIASPSIGVFDSGIGGLSILAAVKSKVPSARFVYAADNAHFPYGTRSRDEIIKLTSATVRAMLKRAKLDIVIIACNTASTAALKSLREQFSVEFVGVVPAVKPAAAATRTKCIGLLATPTTIAGDYTNDLIRSHAPEIRVVRVGSRRLVELAELKLRGLNVAVNDVRAEIMPLFNQLFNQLSPASSNAVDAVVLGCTHFPLLIDELKAAAPWPVAWIDSGAAVAARVADLLQASVTDREPSESNGDHLCLVTSLADTETLRPALLQFGFTDIEYLPVKA